jgi:hypothetical protein
MKLVFIFALLTQVLLFHSTFAQQCPTAGYATDPSYNYGTGAAGRYIMFTVGFTIAAPSTLSAITLKLPQGYDNTKIFRLGLYVRDPANNGRITRIAQTPLISGSSGPAGINTFNVESSSRIGLSAGTTYHVGWAHTSTDGKLFQTYINAQRFTASSRYYDLSTNNNELPHSDTFTVNTYALAAGIVLCEPDAGGRGDPVFVGFHNQVSSHLACDQHTNQILTLPMFVLFIVQFMVSQERSSIFSARLNYK